VIKGTLHIQDGKISAIDTGVSTLAAAQDLQGDYLLPGLIELHTDNLEKHYSPRPGVIWPSLPAVISHDAQISAAGITTVFDALTLGDDNQKARRSENIRAMTDAVTHAQNKNLLRAEH
ncbi:MAG TPA: phosphonate metabolism protein PhnM, partial [Gammaproteobacteria bacterium]|nr:phosphonate metabolism protein PhnM [Gammaproteobacteria bacterium]